jgi:hypothetical protein
MRLPGGTANRGLVVRVGSTVRRPQTPASPAVHALLRHLEERGFEGAPRFLGEDGAGREVLTFLEGDVPIDPAPPWAHSDDALVSVASLLRRYHEAVRSFDPTKYRWLTRVPERYRGGLVMHNDPNLDNVVFRGGEAVALIDFDLASPGRPLWDVALAARLWVPLRDPADTPEGVAERVPERLRLFATAYGLAGQDLEDLALATRETHSWSYAIVSQGARRGMPGYAGYWQRAMQERFLRSRDWFEHSMESLVGAVSRR